MIDNSIDQATGMIRLRAEFANADARLWPGQFVTTRLRTGMQQQVLVVPARSLRQGIDGAYLYRVAADGEQQKAAIVKVQPSYLDDEIAVIPQGLEAGDRVVIDGHSRLKPNSSVVIAGDPAEKPVLPVAGKAAGKNAGRKREPQQ